MLKYLIPLSLIWGTNWVVLKVANRYFPPDLFVAWRMLAGTALMVLLIPILKIPRPGKKDLLWIVITAILQLALGNLAMQWCLTGLDAGLAAILNYTMPLWVIILARIFLHDPLTLRKIAGLALSLGGLILTIGVTPPSSAALPWMILILVSAMLWAVSVLIVRVKLAGLNPLTLITSQLIVGTIILEIYTAVFSTGEIIWCASAFWCLAYNGIFATAVAFLLFNLLITRFDAGNAAISSLTIPAVGAISGFIFLGEWPGFMVVTGMLLILSGVAVVNWHRPKARKPRRS